MQQEGTTKAPSSDGGVGRPIFEDQPSRFTPDAFWEWDIETGHIFRNRALQNLIGFNPDKTQDLSWWLQRIDPGDRDRVQKSIDEIISQKANSWCQDYRFKCADGTYKSVTDRGYILYKGDKPVRMIGFLQNTLEVNELECLLQAEKAQQDIKIAKTIVQTQEQERTYIGNELHDNVCQLLASARLYLNLLNPGSKNGKAIQSKASDFILTAIKEIRELSQKLAVTQVKTNGLVCSIEQLLDDIRNTGLFNVKFTSSICGDTEYALNEDKRVALFRIVQEQMNNIIKHSQAKNIRVNLMQNNAGFILYTYDDGRGFDLLHAKKGMGLSNIYTRTKSFNGVVDIVTAPGKGCSVTILMPFDL